MSRGCVHHANQIRECVFAHTLVRVEVNAVLAVVWRTQIDEYGDRSRADARRDVVVVNTDLHAAIEVFGECGSRSYHFAL